MEVVTHLENCGMHYIDFKLQKFPLSHPHDVLYLKVIRVACLICIPKAQANRPKVEGAHLPYKMIQQLQLGV